MIHCNQVSTCFVIQTATTVQTNIQRAKSPISLVYQLFKRVTSICKNKICVLYGTTVKILIGTHPHFKMTPEIHWTELRNAMNTMQRNNISSLVGTVLRLSGTAARCLVSIPTE